MKKILIFFFLILLFTAFVFVFIPPKIIILESKVIGTPRNGFRDCLHDLKKWGKWWPNKDSNTIFYSLRDSLFKYKGCTYKFLKPVSDGVEVQIQYNSLVLESRIYIIPNTGDSVLVKWSTVLPTSNNPFSKLVKYFEAVEIQKSMHPVFDSLCMFSGETENVYDFPIIRTTFTDTILTTYNLLTHTYPTTKEIYNAINDMKEYITNQGAIEKDYPMMNVKRLDSLHYETMIAICINKQIPNNKEYSVVRMVNMKDRFLATDVTGGPSKLELAHEAIEKYMDDRSLAAPARPFEVLITDRSKEPDTAKWKTKIFHPSM